MVAKLTDSRIAALKPKGQRYEVWADGGGGFGVRVTPRGAKSFVWVYHHQGRPRRLTLGNYPKMSLADAHVVLGKARQMLKRGEDPAKTAVAEREAERKAETIDQLITDYLDRHARPNKRSAGEDERILNKDVLPHWQGRKARDIQRRDVVRLLDRLVDRKAPIAANRLHSLLTKFFNFAVERGVVPHSPCAGVKKPHKEQARERNLAMDEIAVAWPALDRSTMEPNLRRALRLMLVLGQRKGEVLWMHDSEIDRAAKLWTIPGVRRKNGLPHVVPLSPLALEIIGDPPDKDGPGWIFLSGRTGEPYRGPSADHALRDLFVHRKRRRGKKPKEGAPILTGMESFTPHDLRRSVATRMRELGVSRDDVKLVIGHADRSVTGKHYDKWEGLEEKRRALALWAQRLSEIIAGTVSASNVVPIMREA